MASYQILYWRNIPAQVKATDEKGKRLSRALPDRFQAHIDHIAMKEGLAGTDAYLNQWRWTEKRSMPGSAEQVVEAVIRELEKEFDPAA